MPSLPVVPARSFGFTAFSVGNPTTPLPGNQIDINLDAGLTASQQILTWSRTVIGDTGGLKSGVVEAAHLAPGLLATITASVAPDISAQVSTATTAAAQAVISAAGAVTSATLSGTRATAAQASASTAATMATDAATSATLALTRATTAGNHAVSASNYLNDAQLAATTASFALYDARAWADYLPGVLPSDVTSRSLVTGDHWSARFHANAANAAASTATGAISASATSAASAAASATTATTQAGIATSQASNATARWDEFRATYYGASATVPTLDPLGAAITTGDLYFDTTVDSLRVKSASSWLDIGAPDTSAFARLNGSTFTGPILFSPGTMAPFAIAAPAQGIVVPGLRAATADAWSTSRTISVTTDATGSAAVTGAADVSIAVTLANSGVAAGTYGLATVIVDAKGRVTSATDNLAAVVALTNATSSTTPATGALRTAGGLGVAGNLNAGGAVRAPTLVGGAGDASASPLAGTIRGANAIGTNLASQALTIASGQSTGTGNGGSILIQTPTTGTSGAVANTQVTRMTITSGTTADITIPAAANLIVTNAPSASNHAVRRDDLGYEAIGSATLVGSASVQITIPTGFKSVRVRVHGASFSPGVVDQVIYLQTQIGGSYPSGAAVTHHSILHQTSGSGVFGVPFIDTTGSGTLIGYGGYNAPMSSMAEIAAPNDGMGVTIHAHGIGFESTVYGWHQTLVMGMAPTGILTAIRVVNGSSGNTFATGSIAVWGSRT